MQCFPLFPLGLVQCTVYHCHVCKSDASLLTYKYRPWSLHTLQMHTDAFIMDGFVSQTNLAPVLDTSSDGKLDILSPQKAELQRFSMRSIEEILHGKTAPLSAPDAIQHAPECDSKQTQRRRSMFTASSCIRVTLDFGIRREGGAGFHFWTSPCL